jgi:hypothetical protein
MNLASATKVVTEVCGPQERRYGVVRQKSGRTVCPSSQVWVTASAVLESR